MRYSLPVLLAALSLHFGCGTEEEPSPSDAGDETNSDVTEDVAPDAPDCSRVPACELLCPAGTHNPTDADGCEHTCRCVPDGDECAPAECGPRLRCPAIECDDGSLGGCTNICLRDENDECAWEVRDCPSTLQRWETCGDPVCSGHTDRGLPACTTEVVGDACTVDGETCDPIDDCNAHIVCAASDPRAEGCPISRRAFKQDIRYLDDAERADLANQILGMRLASWRYIAAPEREHVGFILDDVEPSPAVDSTRDQADLYATLAMTIATVQQQAAEIRALREELNALRTRLDRDAAP